MWAFPTGQQERVCSWLEPKLQTSRSQASRPMVALAYRLHSWLFSAPWRTVGTSARRASVTQDIGTSSLHRAVTMQ